MKRALLTPIFLVVATSTALADGAPRSSSERAADSDCARAQKAGRACVLTFGVGDDIEGGVPTGEGTVIDVRDFGQFTSLIRLRVDFRAEIIKAAEDL